MNLESSHGLIQLFEDADLFAPSPPIFRAGSLLCNPGYPYTRK